jgi:hypothetical protein
MSKLDFIHCRQWIKSSLVSINVTHITLSHCLGWGLLLEGKSTSFYDHQEVLNKSIKADQVESI